MKARPVRTPPPGFKPPVRKLKNNSEVNHQAFSKGVKFLESKDSPQAEFIILGVPLEATETFRGGVKNAPDEIRRVSQSIESYSSFFNYDLKNLKFFDRGNLSLSGALKEDLSLIEGKISILVKHKKRFVALGGEHTVSLGVVKGVQKILGGNFQIIVFDAHSDFRDKWEGERINHSTVIRRLHQINKKISVVGARSFFGYEDYSQPIYTDLDEAKKRLKKELPVYLSIDMDVLDAGIAPGVTNPEPDGLTYMQLVDFVRFLKDFSVLGVDIVEVSPPFDPSQITSITAAKVVVEVLMAMHYK